MQVGGTGYIFMILRDTSAPEPRGAHDRRRRCPELHTTVTREYPVSTMYVSRTTPAVHSGRPPPCRAVPPASHACGRPSPKHLLRCVEYPLSAFFEYPFRVPFEYPLSEYRSFEYPVRTLWVLLLSIQNSGCNRQQDRLQRTAVQYRTGRTDSMQHATRGAGEGAGG